MKLTENERKQNRLNQQFIIMIKKVRSFLFYSFCLLLEVVLTLTKTSKKFQILYFYFLRIR